MQHMSLLGLSGCASYQPRCMSVLCAAFVSRYCSAVVPFLYASGLLNLVAYFFKFVESGICSICFRWDYLIVLLTNRDVFPCYAAFVSLYCSDAALSSNAYLVS